LWPTKGLICSLEQFSLSYFEKSRCYHDHMVCLFVFNATFNNISVISRRSVSLVEETVGPEDNHRPVTSHGQTDHMVPVQSVPITTKVVSSNPVHCVEYLIQLYMIKFITAGLYNSYQLPRKHFLLANKCILLARLIKIQICTI
jgi:hypothetical protein